MGAAALLFTIFSAVLPEELVWKALFWIGIAPAGLVFWIRRHVEEPAPSVQRAQPVGFSDSSSGS